MRSHPVHPNQADFLAVKRIHRFVDSIKRQKNIYGTSTGIIEGNKGESGASHGLSPLPIWARGVGGPPFYISTQSKLIPLEN